MDKTSLEIDKIIHQDLIPLQGKFRSWLELANGNFRFEPKTFHKAIEAIQKVIDIARDLAKEE